MAYFPVPQVVSFTPGDPTGQTSATYVMMGLGTTATITPVYTGRVLLIATGVMGNSGAAGDGTTIQMSFGTGTAPANNAAVTGTQLGNQEAFIASTTAGQQGFCLISVTTAMTVGTATWIDIALKTVTGGPGFLKTVEIIAVEI